MDPQINKKTEEKVSIYLHFVPVVICSEPFFRTLTSSKDRNDR
jgi:hypothetical protein